MAGISNQPAPRPSNLKSPVPEQSALDSFMQSEGAAAGKTGTSGSALDQFMATSGGGQAPSTGQAPQSSDGGVSFPGSGAVQTVADWLPAAGGIAGGIAGTPLGPAGMIGGAAFGGAAGQGYKQWIEENVLKKTPVDPNQALLDDGKAFLKEGLSAAGGLGIAKVAGMAAKTGVGSAIIDAVSDVAAKPLAMMKGVVSDAVNKIQEPLTKLLSEKTTALDMDQAGSSVKNLVLNNIKQKYGGFIQAYSDIDAVGKALPVADEARRGFTEKTKAWALDELGGDNYKVVKKFTDDINAAGNGKQIDDVIKSIADAKRSAFQSGATNQGKVLQELQTRANDFVDGQATKLAARIKAGKATADEMGFLNQLAEQRGVDTTQFYQRNKQKYVQQLADDFLSGKAKVTKDYGEFRGFLEDVGEQTKVNVNARGPMNFMDAISDVPNEKLMERMFDPKNVNALRTMQKQMPEVYDQVVKSKMSQLVEKSSPEGALDLVRLRKNLNAVPAPTRSLLMTSDEFKTMNTVLDNPRLARLQAVNEMGNTAMLKWASHIAEVMRTGAEAAGPKAAAVLNAPGAVGVGVRRAVGQPAGNALFSAFGGGQQAPMQPDQGSGQ